MKKPLLKHRGIKKFPAKELNKFTPLYAVWIVAKGLKDTLGNIIFMGCKSLKIIKWQPYRTDGKCPVSETLLISLKVS